jgi:hypothetical protein
MTKKTAIKTLATACFQQEGKNNPEHGCTLDVMALCIANEAVLRVLYRYWAWDWTTVDYPYSGTVENLAKWVNELSEFDNESAFSFVSVIDRKKQEHRNDSEGVAFRLPPDALPLLTAY